MKKGGGNVQSSIADPDPVGSGLLGSTGSAEKPDPVHKQTPANLLFSKVIEYRSGN